MISSIIKNINFLNPILVASGTYGYGDEVDGIADVNSLGGIVTKSVTLHPREGNHPPRIAETSSGMLNSIGLANLGVDVFCKEKLPSLNSIKTNIIVNIAGSSVEEYIKVLDKLEDQKGNYIDPYLQKTTIEPIHYTLSPPIIESDEHLVKPDK